MLNQVFKNKSTLVLPNLTMKAELLQRSSFLSRSQSKICQNNCRKFEFLHSNRFSFSKVSHLINPFTKELVSDKNYISDDAIVERVTKVTEQQKQWKKLTPNQRVDLVKKFTDAILNDQQKLTPMIANEIGKSYKNIQQQFQQLRDQVPLLLGQGTEALETLTMSETNEGIVKIVPEPIGVTMIFPHFSEPIFDSMIHLIPCLVSGCAALIKPADYNHFLGPYLQKTAKQTLGFDIVADLFIQPEDLSKLSQFRSFKKVVYSGSHSSAKHIFEVLTEKRFIDCNMYFGGQDAFFIDETANINEAINETIKAAFTNNGQTYDSVKRLYVKEEIYETVVQSLKQRILEIKLGDPKDDSTDQGPLAIPQSASTLEELVNQAISLGAKCEVGGSITSVESGLGIFFEPTLLTEATNDMSLLQTHTPAPILCCFCVTSDDDFLNNFNDSRFGAKVKIFTKEGYPKQILSRYEYIINNLQVGSIVINRGSVRTSNRRLQSWKASTNNRKSSSRIYEEFTILKALDI